MKLHFSEKNFKRLACLHIFRRFSRFKSSCLVFCPIDRHRVQSIDKKLRLISAFYSVEGESGRETTIELTECYECPIGMSSNTTWQIFSVKGGDTLQFHLTEKIRKVVFDGLLLGMVQRPQSRNFSALGVTLLVSPSQIAAEVFEYFPYNTVCAPSVWIQLSFRFLLKTCPKQESSLKLEILLTTGIAEK